MPDRVESVALSAIQEIAADIAGLRGISAGLISRVTESFSGSALDLTGLRSAKMSGRDDLN